MYDVSSFVVVVVSFVNDVLFCADRADFAARDGLWSIESINSY
jgi:hypothetical protein